MMPELKDYIYLLHVYEVDKAGIKGDKMKKILEFIKKETVLTVAWILAFASAFIIHPNKNYLGYIDFKSLGTLWSLMVIMSGLKSKGFFENIGKSLLSRTKYVWQLVVLLVVLPFVFSMFITNDVALLTFVPFSIFILKMCNRENLLIIVIGLQTLAANLGSMLTPIGNPQNLYLYGISNMSLMDFLALMLPYSLLSLLMLLISIVFIKGKSEIIVTDGLKNDEGSSKIQIQIYVYAILFIISLLTVAKVIEFWWLVVIVLIACLVMDRHALVDIDYALLFTFVGFFIFTGNLGNIDSVKNALTSVVGGYEIITGIISSQFISNVPAALLLSEFTKNLNGLIIGVNLGGLGTLIASMASLISFKLLAHSYNELKGKYLIVFTLLNIVFLVVLLALASFI